MRVLVLGWEFPPAIVGGLGMACYGLCRGLTDEGAEVTVVLPGGSGAGEVGGIRLITTDVVAGESVGAPTVTAAPVGTGILARAYEPDTVEAERTDEVERSVEAARSAADVVDQVNSYAAGVERIARAEPFDIIHAHDWMTYPAGLQAHAVTGRPLVCHVHSTEFDRCGENGNGAIVDIERRALRAADQVVAVSAHTKGVVVHRYGVDPERIVVVYNAIDGDTVPPVPETVVKPWERVVVFLGRLAFQKGPDYFVEAAARVLERMEGVKFVLAGRGPMMPQLIFRVAQLRRGKDILFAGFLDREAVGRIFTMADVYVMTSVSEPFGIAALEAMARGVPAIIPREAGVGEVVANVLRVDFWDVASLADRMLAVLRHDPLRRTLGDLGQREVGGLSWRESARRCLAVYRGVLGREARR